MMSPPPVPLASWPVEVSSPAGSLLSSWVSDWFAAADCVVAGLVAGPVSELDAGLPNKAMAEPAPRTIIAAAAATHKASRRARRGGVTLGKRVETTPRLVGASP